MKEVARHPSKFSVAIMQHLHDVFAEKQGWWVLDPFAGVGKIHQLRDIGIITVGIEIEPEWADESRFTYRGDALDLPYPDECFDAICTSPCYGNRMSDNFKAGDDSVRHTYRAYLGREVSTDSSAKMQWGAEYRRFHELAWIEATRVLKPGGKFVLNTSNHIRAGEEQLVTEFHGSVLVKLGYTAVGAIQIETPRHRFGANRLARVDHETVGIWRRA